MADGTGFVHSTAQIGNSLRVLVDRELRDPEAELLKVLNRAALPIDDCKLVAPSLEDVFVAATQARKRSEQAK
jgi:hypothetical protein